MTNRPNLNANANSARQSTVLVVDDEEDLRTLLEITLGRMGLAVRTAASLAEARHLLDQNTFDLCLTDMRLPDGRGMELVEQVAREVPSLPVAVITAYGNMELAVEAMRAGAFDCVSKPLDIAQLRALVSHAIRPVVDPVAEHTSDGLVGESPAMQRLKERIAKLAQTQAPVCINGESGSGKEVIARMIHSRSNRRDHPFIAVNCGAIPDELMESEFFGHLKGSFTGAHANRSGFFQAAEGGTLFLDEIADMPLAMQVKLLRAIQERRVRPVGAEEEQPVDVRILSASHKRLHEEVQAGRFREDLYYRINVIELKVPPLRERRQDIPLLSRALLQRIAQRNGGSEPVLHIDDQALSALIAYTFPGNVRELENILERAAALCEHNLICCEDLALEERPRTRQQLSMREFSGNSDGSGADERDQLVKALEIHHWNRTAAARELGLTLRQLRYRIKKYDLE
ncbi:sigma-54-dependent Fis family transcriptional regulator [Marinobacterium zhoushanense]|uniref:Sigma-54-dependent Fis family transcriptional regulator n=1 Tax=Marinobacterium zhoushanense TaxID=1679163 RepID=A0ABQ1K810_9GAMM|nr:sigma-54 dependent transcriptional regulator [Marinobacterium zhoushanense]GGB87399.1 sigma-54-dependent Fis family transcriptional regulator [Marinobacterium zhoushanense]